MEPVVRAFRPSEWRAYREIRLRALADSPDAFGSTLAVEESTPAERWESSLARAATSGVDLPLLAEVDRRAAGLAWAKVDASNALVVNLFQMWVAPEFRGKGIGSMLVRAAVGWARSRDADSVRLRVTCGDTPAARLYAREGFHVEGQREPLRPGSPLQSQAMSLRLNKGAA